MVYLEIPEERTVGVRVGGGGAITTIENKTDQDGRLSFNILDWKNFLQDEHLQVGQAILITARETRRRNLIVMFVIDIIINLPPPQ